MGQARTWFVSGLGETMIAASDIQKLTPNWLAGKRASLPPDDLVTHTGELVFKEQSSPDDLQTSKADGLHLATGY
jgi:hypothetical protein